MTDEQIAKLMGWPSYNKIRDRGEGIMRQLHALVAAAEEAERERNAKELAAAKSQMIRQNTSQADEP
jgi:hypothetical protein